MTWQDYFVGKFIWEVVFPIGVVFALFIGCIVWIAFDSFLYQPLKNFFKRPK